jgi:hypothetical protein
MTGPRGTRSGSSTYRSCRTCRGTRPVRSELTCLLVSLGKQYAADAPGGPWETYYAREIARHFQPSGG